MLGWIWGITQLIIILAIIRKVANAHIKHLEAKEKLQRIQRRNTVRTNKLEDRGWNRISKGESPIPDATQQEISRDTQARTDDTDWVPR